MCFYCCFTDSFTKLELLALSVLLLSSKIDEFNDLSPLMYSSSLHFNGAINSALIS